MNGHWNHVSEESVAYEHAEQQGKRIQPINRAACASLDGTQRLHGYDIVFGDSNRRVGARDVQAPSYDSRTGVWLCAPSAR
jgi:hypothetical protein